MPTSVAKVAVQKMYIAYYGRPADPGGLDYWATQLDNTSGADLTGLVNAFGASPEFSNRFSNQAPDQLVENIYQFLFSRPADAAGKAFFVGRLDSGESTLANIALDILNGALNDDLTVVNNKLLTASYFSTIIELGGWTYGSEQISAANAMLSATTVSSANLQAASSTAATFPGGGFNAVPTASFGDDVVEARANTGRDLLVGLSGADIFEFQIGESTLASLDRVGDYNISEGDRIDFFGIATGIAPNVTDIDVNIAIGGVGDVRASVSNGIITLFGADAGAVDTLEEWGTVTRAGGLIDVDQVAGFVFNGHTYLSRNESNITGSLIELLGLAGTSAISNTEFTEGTVFVS